MADIFVALAEDRPYRKRLERPEVERLMWGMSEQGKIDRRLVATLFDVYSQADEIVKSAPEVSFEKKMSAKANKP